MVTAHQIRAGRAMIGMGQKDLAEAAGLAVATLRRMENDTIGPERSSFAAVESVCEVLRGAGVIFIAENGEGPGVRLRKAGPLTFLQFIRQTEKTNDAVGDFIGDARMDRTMPDAADWPELEAYLERRGASQAAINAGEATWDRYIATRDAKAK